MSPHLSGIVYTKLTEIEIVTYPQLPSVALRPIPYI